jgi:hypothetical protein
MKNIASFATDGVPLMMRKKRGSLKIMKDENSENLVYKKFSPVLNEVLNSVIKCINTIKTNSKC